MKKSEFNFPIPGVMVLMLATGFLVFTSACAKNGTSIDLNLDATKLVKKKQSTIRYVHKDFNIRFVPRPPQGTAAFYFGRGFPEAMVNEIRKTCFITVSIRNKTDKLLLHDLSTWSFTQDGKPLKRIHRQDWFALWKQKKFPLRFQSTFRWTLMPEKLDYRPAEREGGNITLPRQSDKPIQIKLRLVLSKNPVSTSTPTSKLIGKTVAGKTYHITLNNVRCANDVKEKK